MKSQEIALNQSARRLQRHLNAVGALIAVIAALQSLLSFGLAASQPMPPDYLQVRFFGELMRAWPYIAWMFDGRRFTDNTAFFICYLAPISLMTAIAAWGATVLLRQRTAVREVHVNTVFRWSILVALMWLPAFNVLTQDFWLSVAWGRMLNFGVNPYEVQMTSEFLAGLPLDHQPFRSTYGPLWTLLSALITALSFGSVLATWILFKSVLLAGWLWVLVLVRKLMGGSPPMERALALLMLGLTPICGYQTVAEGHNDIAMVAFMLCWLGRLPGFDRSGPAMLAASVLSKFVTAPLIVVDLAYHRLRGVRAALWRSWPAVIGSVLIFFLLIRSPSSMSQTAGMASWRFFDLAMLLRIVEEWIGLRLGPVHLFVFVAAALFSGLKVLKLWRNPTQDGANAAALAIMATILFTCVGHVWPWFFVWVIPLAVTQMHSRLSALILGAGLASPFMIAHWWRLPDMGIALKLYIPGLAMYASALIGFGVHHVLRVHLNRAQRTSNMVGASAS